MDITINPSTKKNIKAFTITIIACLILLGISIGTFVDGNILGLLGIVLFSFLIIYAIKQRAGGKMGPIFISEAGLKTNFPYKKEEYLLPWADIDKVWIKKFQNQKLLYITLKNPDQYPKIRDFQMISRGLAKQLANSVSGDLKFIKEMTPDNYNICLTDSYELSLEEIETKIKERLTSP